MPRLFYFNTSFDFDIGGGLNEKLRPVCGEMSLYSFLVLEKGDAAVVSAGYDRKYTEHLSSLGFFPRNADDGESAAEFCGVAWGWNRESEKVLTSYNTACAHPPFDVVKRVNSRSFSSIAASEMGLPGAGDIILSSSACDAYLSKESRRPLLFKPMFGSSGSGFVTVTGNDAYGRAKEKLRAMCDNGGAVAEPLFDRLNDYGVNFTVSADGSFHLDSIHRSLVSPGGKFFGIYMADDIPSDDGLLHVEETLASTAERAAGYLHKEGYFGPAGIDAFTYREDGVIKLNPMCEINARYSMGRVARSCRAVLGGTCSILTQLRNDRSSVPGDYAELESVFGPDLYDARKQRGIALLSPLRIVWENDRRPPLFSLVYIASHDADDCRYLVSVAERALGKNVKRKIG
jgi:hypothetical protein